MEYIKINIDDSYINEMAEYYERQGKQLQGMIDSYLDIMKRVTEDGIVQGDTSEALKAFLAYAEKLRQSVLNVSTKARDMTGSYLEEIDNQDKYYLS